MCGRTACTLAPDDICRACRQKRSDGSYVEPRWQNAPGGGSQYYPSYNLPPSRFSPVLISKDHFPSSKGVNLETEGQLENGCKWIVQPMQWGLVPHWHKGENSRSFGYKMNNARSDGMLSKATFKQPLEMGRRCVVLADGYYEWQTRPDGKRQPYFIFFPENSNGSELKEEIKTDAGETKPQVSKFEEVVKKSEEEFIPELSSEIKIKQEAAELLLKSENKKDDKQSSSSADCWQVKRLLTMAGLFDIWKSSDNEPLYSFSIITVDAHPDLNWIHDRMPAILNGDEEVNNWLDYKSVPLDEAVQLIRPKNCLTSYPVSTWVSDSRNNSKKCVERIDPNKEKHRKKKLTGSGNFMNSWLKVGEKHSATNDNEEGSSNAKKIKH